LGWEGPKEVGGFSGWKRSTTRKNSGRSNKKFATFRGGSRQTCGAGKGRLEKRGNASPKGVNDLEEWGVKLLRRGLAGHGKVVEGVV